MCSININSSADETLKSLGAKDRKMIENRLIHFSEEASVENSGALDMAPLTRFTGELKFARKKQIGRHRVYYTGFHTQCSYHAFHS